MKVLVTGATGFTGFNVAKGLKREGHEVHALVRPTSRTDDLLALGVTLHTGRLEDPRAVDDAVRGMDQVHHIAASYREGKASYQSLFDANVTGTQNIIDACRKHNVKRLIHCSTVGVHGHIDHPPANEDAPFKPGDEYQTTKLEGEKRVLEAIKSGLPATIFRPVGIFGPGDRRFLKLFKSVQKGTFIMFGDGEILYHLTFIDDLVDGILTLGKSDRALGQIFIIAGPKATTLNELVERIAKTLSVPKPKIRIPFPVLWTASVLCEFLFKPLGIEPPLYRRRADFFRKDRAFDTSKMERITGFHPKIALEDGLARTAAWYKSAGLLN